MSSCKSFAVAGAGAIGIPIVHALLAKGVSVVVLSRSSRPAPAGASAVTVDYADVPALTETLRKHAIDVVISTFNNDGLPVQPALADAAKAAGVKLFLPSEFGSPTEGAKTGLFGDKDASAKYLAKIGLPYARIYTGFFTSFIPWVTGITDTGKVHIIGNGNTPLSITSEEDIAGFVAHITTSLPLTDLANKSFRIQGDRATLRELAALFNKPVVEHDGPPVELSSLHGFFLTIIEAGNVSTGYDPSVEKDVGTAGEANMLWPEHHWTTVEEFFKL